MTWYCAILNMKYLNIFFHTSQTFSKFQRKTTLPCKWSKSLSTILQARKNICDDIYFSFTVANQLAYNVISQKKYNKFTYNIPISLCTNEMLPSKWCYSLPTDGIIFHILSMLYEIVNKLSLSDIFLFRHKHMRHLLIHRMITPIHQWILTLLAICT